MAIIIRALSNLEKAAVEADNLKGLNFGAFMRMRMIEKFAKKEKEAA